MKKNAGFLGGMAIGTALTIAVGFVSSLNAQLISTSPSGKYGCLVNKNFAGYDAYLDGSNRVGYHYMLQFDFESKKSQIINIHLIDNYGKANIKTNWAAGAGGDAPASGAGTIEVSADANYPGAYLIRSINTSDGKSYTTTYMAMSVNSGNTLLVSSGAGGNADSTPFTGLCNKV
jgi:hypothetical protein